MFTKKDMGFLQDIFALARVHTVTSEPKNRQQLENVMNFEAVIGSKLVAANEELGFVEPEEPAEEPELVSTEEVPEGEPEATD